MSWLIFVIITVFVDALRIFIDNYVSDVYFKGRGAVSQKWFYGWVTTVFMLIVLSIIGWDQVFAQPMISGILLSAGVISGVSGIFYLKALEIDESTDLGIFIQMAPVLYLIFGWMFLGESFSPMQLVAFAIILTAPVLIVLTTRKKSRKVRMKAVMYSFLYVLVAVISNMIFVEANGEMANVLVSISLVLLGKGIANVMIVLVQPRLLRRYRAVVKSSHGKVFRPMCANFVVGMTKEYVYRMALILAPSMAVASAAADTSGPIVIFFMGIVLTLIWPKFGREKLNRKAVLVHLLATVLVVIGIVILQVK